MDVTNDAAHAQFKMDMERMVRIEKEIEMASDPHYTAPCHLDLPAGVPASALTRLGWRKSIPTRVKIVAFELVNAQKLEWKRDILEDGNIVSAMCIKYWYVLPAPFTVAPEAAHLPILAVAAQGAQHGPVVGYHHIYPQEDGGRPCHARWAPLVRRRCPPIRAPLKPTCMHVATPVTTHSVGPLCSHCLPTQPYPAREKGQGAAL